MNDDLYNYIYDAMNWALEYMDTVYTDDNGREQYDKLDKAIGKFANWYDKSCEQLEEIQSICIGADSPDAHEHAERDPKTELEYCQKDLSAISNITEKLLQIAGVE